MAIRFRCECGQKLRVGDDRAGMQARCPKCRRALTVPHPSSTIEPEPARSAQRAGLAVPGDLGDVTIAIRAGSDPGRRDPAEDVLPEIVIRDDSADWLVSPQPLPQYGETAIDYDKVAVPRRVLYLQGGLLAVLALLSFVLGILVGGGNRPRDTAQQPVQPCVLTGQVQFTVDNGPRPDGGSVVIALPADRRPTPNDRVAIAGLRPDDPVPLDTHASLRAIRGLGGDCVRANEVGEYQIRLPRDGQYFVLVISRRAARSATDRLEMADAAQLGRYFDNVVELVEDRKYQWRSVAIRGQTTLDAVF